VKQSAKNLAKGKSVAKAMSAARLRAGQASRRAVPSKERGTGGPASSGKAKAPGGMPARSAKRKVAPRPKAVKARPAGKASGVKVALSRTSVSEVKSAGKQADGKTYTRLDHIDDATLDKIIAKLEEMRAESQATVNTQVSSALKPLSEEADVGDDMDLASRDRDREFNLLEHERHLRRLQQIAEAFERIKDGTYGLCEGTDEPINPKRLLIMPLARYSLEYQQEQEKMLGRTPEEFYFEEESALEGEEE
jgi:DnaK suppressor protein